MREHWPSLFDGIVTGLVVALVLSLPCLATERSMGECGGWVFSSGAIIGCLSAVWTIAGYHSPPGLISLLRDDVEIYPSAGPDELWIDRFISPRNVWLVAGLTMVTVSFLPPFLR